MGTNQSALVALCLTCLLVGCTNTSTCNTLPVGYGVVTDGKHFRFKWPSGNISIFDEDTKEEAIESACMQNANEIREATAIWVDTTERLEIEQRMMK